MMETQSSLRSNHDEADKARNDGQEKGGSFELEMRAMINAYRSSAMSRLIWSLKSVARRIGLTRVVNRLLYADGRQLAHGLKTDHENTAYLARLGNEQAHFAVCENVHDLPEIFHYWSNKYLRPSIEKCGFSHPDEFFVIQLEKTFAGDKFAQRRFVSIGAGNCDTEVRLAGMLKQRGYERFVIECVDINKTMLLRGAALAAENGVSANISTQIGDFNSWQADGYYHAVIANQSLHHVTELEHLFDTIKVAIHEDGLFVTSDMIGRNGHQRWPEALAIVKEFWEELSAEKRFNLQLQRQETEFLDWDCSVSGFEGIRSQDVLPQLLSRFEFQFFYAFGNVIDPFVDRSFGHHFDPDNAADRGFIDRIHARDQAELDAGHITPTHMFAVLKNGTPGQCTFSVGCGPSQCIRLDELHGTANR